MKAYGNITVAMIMRLSFIRYSYWFVKHKKEILSQQLRSLRTKAVQESVQESRKTGNQ